MNGDNNKMLIEIVDFLIYKQSCNKGISDLKRIVQKYFGEQQFSDFDWWKLMDQ